MHILYSGNLSNEILLTLERHRTNALFIFDDKVYLGETHYAILNANDINEVGIEVCAYVMDRDITDNTYTELISHRYFENERICITILSHTMMDISEEEILEILTKYYKEEVKHAC